MSDETKNGKINYFAMTDVRGKHTAFGIKPEDRLRHMYVIGKTGMGKSTMLENMAIQDIQNGKGLCFIDPHGSTAEKLLEFIPQDRIQDVIYFAPFDVEYPIGFNVMEDVGYEKRHLVVAGLMSAFKRVWVDAWSSRMEYILQNVLLALLEYPDSTLVDINRMLINKEFRNKVLDKVTDPMVLEFWKVEFAGYTDRYAQEATPAIQNKIGQFVANPLVRNIVAQPDSAFDIREIMDTKKIFIVNLSKGRMGEQNADLVGSMLVTKMYLSAMSRAEEGKEELRNLPPFYLYVDEFQSVVNDSFANILSEARKYKLALIIAHQYVEQMDENIRNAVFGNVGTTISFRVGPFDAQVLETLFKPTFFADDLVNLSFAQIYLTLMIDGVGSRPFSAKTIAPFNEPSINFVEDIIAYTRKTYAKTREQVEVIIEKNGIIPKKVQKQQTVTTQQKRPNKPANKQTAPRTEQRKQADIKTGNRKPESENTKKSIKNKDKNIEKESVINNNKKPAPTNKADLQKVINELMGKTKAQNMSQKTKKPVSEKKPKINSSKRQKNDNQEKTKQKGEQNTDISPELLKKIVNGK